MRGMTREYAAGNSRGPGWHESSRRLGSLVDGSGADGAVRREMEGLSIVPGRD